MKILLSTPFDFQYPGGVNDHLIHLDRELRNQGHDTRVLSPLSDSTQPEVDGHHVRIGRSIPIPANGSTARITLSPFVNSRVKLFLQREQFDVIHLHEPMTPTLQLSVLMHSDSINVGTFHAAHTSYFGYNLCYLYGKPFLSYFVDRLDAKIAVSEPARNFVDYYFPDRYRVIPNGIDYDAFGPHVRPLRRITSGSPTVLFVGRFNESRKGLRFLLRAMATVQQEVPGARLVVVGPGNQERFWHHVHALGLRHVIFAGEVPKADLPACYAACDVFCAPSTGRESFGIVLLEGMAAGKPVVATDIDGYRSVVRHGREGLLVPPRDPDALAAALHGVLTDARLRSRFGAAGRERAREFSWPVVARRVVECYREASQRRTNVRMPSPAASSLFSGTRRP